MNLFRREAVAHQLAEREGKPLVVSPLSLRLLALGVALVLAGIGCLLVWGTYTNQRTVTGYLLPSGGLTTVRAPRRGVVRARYVKLGERVHEGQKLYEIETRRSTRNTANVNSALRQKYRAELRNVDDRVRLAVRREDSTIAELRSERAGIKRQLHALRRRLDAEESLAKLARNNVSRYRPMALKGIVSQVKLQEQLAKSLSAKAATEELHQSEAGLAARLDAFPDRIAGVRSKTADRIATLRDEAGRLEREELQTEASTEMVIRAPDSGVVSSVMCQRGESLDANAPLLSLLPKGSKLEARLLIPSRAVGLVHVGESVRFRYSAFPSQQFGLYSGRLTRLSRSIISPSELSLPVSIHEPYYLATATLDKPYVRAEGHRLPLSAGMTLTAHIVLGRQRLYQWILRPLASLRGGS